MTLIHGDCLQVLPTLADGSVDMVFADLPYGVTGCKWDHQLDLGRLWPELLRVGKPNVAFVFTATMRFATTLIASQPKLFRYDLVWDRRRMTGFFNAARMPMRSHETLLVFYRSLPRYNPQKIARRDGKAGRIMPISKTDIYKCDKKQRRALSGERSPGSILSVADDPPCLGRRRHHPTQKPVALLEWVINTYSNPGDTVLDPTAGSGTTAIAAIRSGRQYVCIERDAAYFATMQARVAADGVPTAPAQEPAPAAPSRARRRQLPLFPEVACR